MALMREMEHANTPAQRSDVGSRSVERALDVLSLVAEAHRRLTLSEIARDLGLPKSSTLQLVRALCSREFLNSDEGGRYGVGVRAFEVGAAYLAEAGLIGTIDPLLRDLTGRLGVTSHFAVLDRDSVLYLAKQDPPGPGPVLASALGARLPAATTAVGLAQLAASEGNVAPERRGAIAQARARGYALDEGETAAGIRCVAAAVFDRQACIGAIGTSSLLYGGLPLATLVAGVCETAERASLLLGGGQRFDQHRAEAAWG